ncbi:class I SAM-dependent methyltransferase [Synechococcus sp. BA-132 BA5]|nr:class I SAM-dependent methyltransferase [Synechococcus sp. BA-132 BA5]
MVTAETLPSPTARACPNCGGERLTPVRRVTVSKALVEAELAHCPACDFLFLADPTWLDVAYEESFYGDTGYVDRNLHAARLLRLLLVIGRLGRFGPSEPGCDLGTGLGMLPRLLRDHGFDFHGTDAYAAMELIRPFCGPPGGGAIGCKTAFEVIEHVPCTPEFLRDEVGATPLFVFSTLMRQAGEIPDPDWWYYAFGNGQHISFHSRRSFEVAMGRAGMDPAWLVCIDGPVHERALHLIAPSPRWRRAFRVAGALVNRGLDGLLLPWLEPLVGLRPRIIPDHYAAMERLRSAAERPPCL